jgi:hypothetical protein
MMLHQDGSWREWLEGQPALDLIVTMDDRVEPTAASTIVIRYDRFTSTPAIRRANTADGVDGDKRTIRRFRGREPRDPAVIRFPGD